MSNRDTAMRYAEEVWNAGNLGAVDEIFTADHVYHDPTVGELPPGPEGVRARVRAYMAAFPDARVAMEEVVEEGDVVAARWTWGGTNTGELMGSPPTGRPAHIGGMHFFRFRGGRIAETWVCADTFGLMQQVGLIPAS